MFYTLLLKIIIKKNGFDLKNVQISQKHLEKNMLP
jgi:hypothetical protein